MPIAAIGALAGGLGAAGLGATTATALGAAGLGASLGGMLDSSSAAKKAAGAQNAALQQGIDTQQQMYQQTRADLAPWRSAGGNALSALAGQLGLPGYKSDTNYTKSPGYDFRMKEGLGAVDSRYGAMGKRLSGERLKALTQYGQNIASEDYGRWMDRLTGLSGAGQASAAGSAQANQANAANLAELYGQRGDVNAAKYGAQNQAGADLTNNLAKFAGQFRTSSYGGFGNAPDYYDPLKGGGF